ncbi:MAG: RICIN domain-containing protein [Candidatus Methanoperedens sp.]|nr:RICIN domain-containing protein [Candidatus Methanoperedens sp.]
MDYYAIIAKHSGKCLDVAGESQEPGANVQQWDCHGGNNQLWKLVISQTPETAGNSTISGYITGERQYVKEVRLQGIDKPQFKLSASFDANRHFAFLNLPDGSYRVTPI